MTERGLKADMVFLDLLLGLTQSDPKKRMTLEQVKNHQWMKGETASATLVRNHFYSLVPGRKCLNKEHYATMQEARKAWAQINRIQRGAETRKNLGYNNDQLI